MFLEHPFFTLFVGKSQNVLVRFLSDLLPSPPFSKGVFFALGRGLHGLQGESFSVLFPCPSCRYMTPMFLVKMLVFGCRLALGWVACNSNMTHQPPCLMCKGFQSLAILTLPSSTAGSSSTCSLPRVSVAMGLQTPIILGGLSSFRSLGGHSKLLLPSLVFAVLVWTASFHQIFIIYNTYQKVIFGYY